MLDLKRPGAVALTLLLVMAGAQALQGQYDVTTGLTPQQAANARSAFVQVSPPPRPAYETRQVHDPNGTGKFYMGREIAQTMGSGGIPWLDRPERDEEEHPGIVIDALGLRDGDVVADLGAGSGYFTFRIAPRVGKAGKVLAVEIQDEMLETIRQRAAALKATNVEEVKGSETDPNLPARGVDLVLMVDVYHELAYPFEVMTQGSRGVEAWRPGGLCRVPQGRPQGSDQRSPQDVGGPTQEGDEGGGAQARPDGRESAIAAHCNLRKERLIAFVVGYFHFLPLVDKLRSCHTQAMPKRKRTPTRVPERAA